MRVESLFKDNETFKKKKRNSQQWAPLLPKPQFTTVVSRTQRHTLTGQTPRLSHYLIRPQQSCIASQLAQELPNTWSNSERRSTFSLSVWLSCGRWEWLPVKCWSSLAFPARTDDVIVAAEDYKASATLASLPGRPCKQTHSAAFVRRQTAVCCSLEKAQQNTQIWWWITATQK